MSSFASHPPHLEKSPAAAKPSEMIRTASETDNSRSGDRAVLSPFLRGMLQWLPLEDRPPSWGRRLWQLSAGGWHGSSLAFVATIGSFLKAVLDSPDLNRRCMAFMDVAIMLGTVFYQVTFTSRRAWTRGMLEELIRLAEGVEDEADDEVLADLRATVRSMRRVFHFMWASLVLVAGLMLVTPLIAGELTMTIYPRPEGALWYLACFVQEVATLTCSVCVGTIMYTLLLLSFGVASLSRCIGIMLQTCRGEAHMVRLVRTHRLVLDVANRLAETYFLTLFCLITGYLTVSLLGTFNVASGNFDAYTVAIVPGALTFYFNIAIISDVLYRDTAGVSDAAWSCPWTEEGVPVRRLVLNVITRAQRAAAVRVPLLGAVTLPVFMDSMRQWYSFLQMIRNINK